jgi:tetratricopeptide (TPR) repeat protein
VCTWASMLSKFARHAALTAFILGASALAACVHVESDAALNRAWDACRQEPGGDYEMSIAACSAIIDALNATDVDRARALNNRGVAFSATGRPEAALADFEQANAADPDNPSPYYNRGALHWENGRYDQALSDISRAIALDGANGEYYNARGLVYEKQGDFDRAVADYSRAITLEPQTGQWRNSRCWLRATHQRDLDAALADCENALSASPGDPYYLDSRGMVHLQRRDWRAAIADYDLALAQNQDLPASYFGRAIARLRLGETIEGQTDLEMARRLDAGIEARFAEYGVEP